ncbi:hypothetical protein SAMN04487866_103147 [Thermoactinomyces sp. DSM 45891]|uniref:hypothetical protein n=1 Tax=Thermoactinomyces sp. DSM 45891 TaxID=1761907 RepID=UPI00092366D8|nr:hypothetical protein [Thermoactinomyces sp. DSM 45891]SFX28474.1 hypothetical protein SAMN04487866_103147 [Thermoactinomyces sp. DSM 45891]
MLRNKSNLEQGFMIPVVMMVIWLVFQFVHAYISQTVAIQQADFLDSERVKARYAATGAIDKVLANWKERLDESKWSWQEASVEQAIQVTLLPSSDSDLEQGQTGILQARATGKLGVRKTITVQIDLETGRKIKEVRDDK